MTISPPVSQTPVSDSNPTKIDPNSGLSPNSSPSSSSNAHESDVGDNSSSANLNDSNDSSNTKSGTPTSSSEAPSNSEASSVEDGTSGSKSGSSPSSLVEEVNLGQNSGKGRATEVPDLAGGESTDSVTVSPVPDRLLSIPESSDNSGSDSNASNGSNSPSSSAQNGGTGDDGTGATTGDVADDSALSLPALGPGKANSNLVSQTSSADTGNTADEPSISDPNTFPGSKQASEDDSGPGLQPSLPGAPLSQDYDSGAADIETGSTDSLAAGPAVASTGYAKSTDDSSASTPIGNILLSPDLDISTTAASEHGGASENDKLPGLILSMFSNTKPLEKSSESRVIMGRGAYGKPMESTRQNSAQNYKLGSATSTRLVSSDKELLAAVPYQMVPGTDAQSTSSNVTKSEPLVAFKP